MKNSKCPIGGCRWCTPEEIEENLKRLDAANKSKVKQPICKVINRKGDIKAPYTQADLAKLMNDGYRIFQMVGDDYLEVVNAMSMINADGDLRMIRNRKQYNYFLKQGYRAYCLEDED